ARHFRKLARIRMHIRIEFKPAHLETGAQTGLERFMKQKQIRPTGAATKFGRNQPQTDMTDGPIASGKKEAFDLIIDENAGTSTVGVR
ncbi:MAG TPA: hypothetical protein VII74_05410, partial [Chthoniobacterales bacterium]